MAPERAAYRPRDAERGVLYTVVRARLETFLRQAAHRADGAWVSFLLKLINIMRVK
jgi:regulator of PEP synthase PpsR (kinase-PPPase family)